MSFLPERELTEPEAEAVSHGIKVPGNGQDGRQRLTHDGHLIAIARLDGENLRPEVVLA
jgi:hypothetical protein